MKQLSRAECNKKIFYRNIVEKENENTKYETIFVRVFFFLSAPVDYRALNYLFYLIMNNYKIIFKTWQKKKK